MPKLDEAKEKLAFLKFWLGLIVGVFTAVAGWTLNKFDINENILNRHCFTCSCCIACNFLANC